MPDKLTYLEEVKMAEAATPGDWWSVAYPEIQRSDYIFTGVKQTVEQLQREGLKSPLLRFTTDNTVFITYFNPARILIMLAERADKDREIERLKRELQERSQ